MACCCGMGRAFSPYGESDWDTQAVGTGLVWCRALGAGWVWCRVVGTGWEWSRAPLALAVNGASRGWRWAGMGLRPCNVGMVPRRWLG